MTPNNRRRVQYERKLIRKRGYWRNNRNRKRLLLRWWNLMHNHIEPTRERLTSKSPFTIYTHGRRIDPDTIPQSQSIGLIERRLVMKPKELGMTRKSPSKNTMGIAMQHYEEWYDHGNTLYGTRRTKKGRIQDKHDLRKNENNGTNYHWCHQRIKYGKIQRI